MGICGTRVPREYTAASGNGAHTHDAPGTLHAELDAERAGGQRTEAAGQDPQGNKCADQADEDPGVTSCGQCLGMVWKSGVLTLWLGDGRCIG